MPALSFDTSALVDPEASAQAQAQARDAVQLAGRYVAQGAIVVFATETFYGLAALPTNALAVGRLATLKGRDKDKPIALIASDVAACAQVCTIPTGLQPLAQAFWPGPLTLLLPVHAPLPHPIAIDGVQGRVAGVRVSSHPVACALSQAAGGIVTATSANLSGQPAVAQISDLNAVLAGAVDVILDAGLLTGQAPSSVVGLGPQGLMHIRPGAVSQAALERAWLEAQRA